MEVKGRVGQEGQPQPILYLVPVRKHGGEGFMARVGKTLKGGQGHAQGRRGLGRVVVGRVLLGHGEDVEEDGRGGVEGSAGGKRAKASVGASRWVDGVR